MAETNVIDDIGQDAGRGMDGGLRLRLSVMMFLQYVIWGAWAPILALHLQNLEDFKTATTFLGLTLSLDTKINLIYMTMAIASILSPFVAGQIADRYFSTERFLAVSHLVGGVLLFLMVRMTTFPALFWTMLVYAIIYSPTVALTNSLTFHHVPNGEKDFGAVRMWGTLGWIAVGWGLGFWLRAMNADVVSCLRVAAGASVVMGWYSLFLPHTPPKENPESPWAFVAALQLMKNRSFSVLVVVSFLVATELQFYYVLTPIYFNQGGGPYDEKALTTILLKEVPPLENPEDSPAKALLAAVGTEGKPAKKISVSDLERLSATNAYARRVLEIERKTVEQKGGVRL
ncbi:MAG: hypothetical protein AMXMBFR83_24410 [Phycisphaerae bacterium]